MRTDWSGTRPGAGRCRDRTFLAHHFSEENRRNPAGTRLGPTDQTLGMRRAIQEEASSRRAYVV